jgi:NAD(P)-dependent dehydrogenase (short-subunit alcohol dehydrogenase family)
MDLNKKVCLVTGGAGGIGSATVLALAQRGADIAVSGLAGDEIGSRALERRITAMGRSYRMVLSDLSTPEGALKCVEETVRRFGTIDVLIHCAGGPAPGGLLEVRPEVWFNTFDVHIHAVFHLCRAAVPFMMAKKEGAIVLISSSAGLRGCAGALAYGVAKGAIPQFTRSLARELANFNIRVNSVAPGIIRTHFQDYLTAEQVRNNIDNRIPLHREGTPEQVADVIVMLVSNDFITGENVAVDGGLTMRIV